MKKNIYTPSEYAKKLGISRQAIYFPPYSDKLIELPVFVEVDGKKIEIEKKKFIIDSTS